MSNTSKKKCYIFAFFLLIANNLLAQQSKWIDPYEMPGAPGYKEIQKAHDFLITNDKKNARIWFEKSAKKGNMSAIVWLAGVMITEDGNIKKGFEYYQFAANQCYVPAVYNMGMLIGDGRYVPRNLETAFGLFKVCVDLDKKFMPGKYVLGMYYINGIGTPKDIVKGVELLKDVALSGDTQSQLDLGNVYYNDAENRNYEEAAKWFSMAAANSNWEAQHLLAYMYARGEGVKQDFVKAHSLIKDANSSFSLAYSNNLEALSDIQAALLSADGTIYLMENKMDEAKAIWNQLKSKYPEMVEKQKFAPESRFIRIMYEQEQNQNNTILASKNGGKQTFSIISDVDEKIPENAIVEIPTFAVIIANENYKEVEGVPYAIRDGEIFKQYCEKTLGIPKSNIKFETDATLNSIKRQLNWLGQVMDVYQGEANIIFYYAGHGIPDEANRSAYLLPVDGYGSDVTTGYSLDKLYADLSDKPAKSVVVLLDACFSGAKRDSGMLASARGVAIKAKQNVPKGNMVVFSAAQGDETAYPYKEKGHGMFTYYLMKKLQDTKGDVTFGELTDYVTSEVKKQSIVVNGKLQTPLVSSSSSAADWQNWKLR